jgi:hypothetical protein
MFEEGYMQKRPNFHVSRRYGNANLYSTSLKLPNSTRTMYAEATEPFAPKADGGCSSLLPHREGDHDHVAPLV